jgi:hypothetical protein
VELFRLSFTESKAGILLIASDDFTHGSETIQVIFSASKEKPFSLRLLQYLNGLADGTTATVTGRCVIMKLRDKMNLVINDASLSP